MKMIEEDTHELTDVLYLLHVRDRLPLQDAVDTLRADPLHPYGEEQVMEEVERLLIVVMIEQDP